MGPRPYILAETTWKAVRDDTREIAVLPWGATAAKGEAFHRAATEAIGSFLIDLAGADPDDMYE